MVELALPVRPGLDLLQLGQEFLAGAALHTNSHVFNSSVFRIHEIRKFWPWGLGSGSRSAIICTDPDLNPAPDPSIDKQKDLEKP